MSRTFEIGFEADQIDGRPGEAVRWWLYVHLDGEDGRPQRPRKGVADQGFHFARGGRAATAKQAELMLEEATGQAETEYWLWRGQPSHMLGRNGELIPLGEALPELAR